MYAKVKINESPKFGLSLAVLAVLVSAMAVLFMLHTGTDDSSADVMDSGQCGDSVNYEYSSDGTLTISGTGGMYDYSKANAPWSEYSSDITKITIDNNITSLGEWAFHDCTNLKELSIPITLNSVRSNEHPAFQGCTNIETINLTYGTNGYGGWYAAYPVDGCWYQNTPWYQSRDFLKELNLADGIVGIGSDTFRELNITSLVLPNTLSIAGDHCFFNCTKLTELTYPISLRPFCNKDYPAFQGCNAIEKVTFTRGNGIPFDYTRSLFSDGTCYLAPWNMNSCVAKVIVISDSVYRLGDYMFYTANIKEISLPISIHFDDSKHAFDGMLGTIEKTTVTKGTGTGYDNQMHYSSTLWNHLVVKTVIVEEGVTHIGTHTFVKSSIENLVLPKSLVPFESGESFYDCSIKNLTIPITLNATWLDDKPSLDEVSGIEKVTFTPGDTGNGFDYFAYYDRESRWYQHTPWYQCRSTLKEIVFEDGIKSIGSDAFRELNLTSLTIPDSVQSLGNHTFFRCDKLTNLTIPISLNTVGADDYPAFNGCTNVRNITFTAGTGDWYSYGQDSSEESYYGKTPWNLTEADLYVNISDGIDTIGTYAFYNCDRLHEIHFEGTCLEHIGARAFDSCTNLASVNIPDSVTSIGTRAFESCTALQSLTIGNSVKTVVDYAFARCSALTDLIVPDSVTSIGNGAFSYCSSLTSADIGKSLPRIGVAVFADCSSLTNVTLWETTTIDPNAFVGCGDVKNEIKKVYFTTVFKNGDKVLQESEVRYRTLPEYAGETPVREATAEHSYKFKGWDHEIVEATEDAIYTAVFDETDLNPEPNPDKGYTIAFMNGDRVLETLTVPEGEVPKYSGETPTKEPTAQYTYEFKGWEPEIVAATGDATYTAVFDEILREYTVTFKNGEEALQQTQVSYGTAPKYDGAEPTKESTAEHSYKFKGWAPGSSP